MTELHVAGQELLITFPGWESIMIRRSSYRVPLAAIAAVELLDDWSSEVLGARVGLVISGYRKLGTFTHPNGTRRLVSMARGLPLLRIRLRDRAQGNGFDELLISSPQAAELASAIRVEARA
jgi:hypothetical protein